MLSDETSLSGSPQNDDPLTYRIIGYAIAVHKQVGPGLLESVYEKALDHELGKSGLVFTRQTALELTYGGEHIGKSYRPDFVIAGEVVLEIKSVPYFKPIHMAQMLTYMKLSRVERGLLINFNVPYLKSGLRRLILTRENAEPV